MLLYTLYLGKKYEYLIKIYDIIKNILQLFGPNNHQYLKKVRRSSQGFSMAIFIALYFLLLLDNKIYMLFTPKLTALAPLSSPQSILVYTGSREKLST